jgi:hypothetical protein
MVDRVKKKSRKQQARVDPAVIQDMPEFQEMLVAYRASRLLAELSCEVGALGFAKGGSVAEAHRELFVLSVAKLKMVKDASLLFDLCAQVEGITGEKL